MNITKAELHQGLQALQRIADALEKPADTDDDYEDLFFKIISKVDGWIEASEPGDGSWTHEILLWFTEEFGDHLIYGKGDIDIPAPVPAPKTRTAPRRYQAEDVLSPEDYAIFERLRDWRNTRAATDLVPRYLVLSNRQLGAMAARRPLDTETLRTVQGFGPSTIERYGDDAIEALVAAITDYEED